MVQVNQAMINPQVAAADYSQLTQAVIRGQDQELIASKEKNARIRASLAEVTMNNKTSADAQATWMGAIDNNEDLLKALNNAPPRIQKAYTKATQGRATLEDNSVISSYLGSVQKQIALTAQTSDNKLNNDLTTAKIDQADAARDASKAKTNVSNAELAALQNSGANPRAATLQALLSPGVAAGGAPTASVNTPTVGAINATSTNDPVARPVTGAMLPEPVATTPQAPATPTGQSLVDNNPFAPQGPVEASVETPEVNPNAPFFTDAKGNRVVASPEAINNPLVAAQEADGVKRGTAIQRVQAKMDLDKGRQEYVLGSGNVASLPTPDLYTAQLYAAGVDLDDAREQTTAAIAQGMVYAPPSSEVIDERTREFDEAYQKETAALSALLEDTQIVENAADRVKSNAGFATSGAIPTWAAAIGLDMPFDGKSAVEMKRALSQLTSSSALTTMQTLKDNSKQGATGLGQVSVVEFTSLIDKASSIDQYLQKGDLEDSVNLYVYDRNKLAYKTYRSMVDKYGAAAVNSKGSISERQISNILKDINTFETTNNVGIKIAARSGYFVDNVGVPQAAVTVESGPDGGTPAPAMSQAERREQSIAAGEAVFNQEQEARAELNSENMRKGAKVAIGLAGPGGLVPMAAQFIAPKIYDFFGGGNAQTEAFSSNIKNISTK
jgi:hypothetical protein